MWTWINFNDEVNGDDAINVHLRFLLQWSDAPPGPPRGAPLIFNMSSRETLCSSSSITLPPRGYALGMWQSCTLVCSSVLKCALFFWGMSPVYPVKWNCTETRARVSPVMSDDTERPRWRTDTKPSSLLPFYLCCNLPPQPQQKKKKKKKKL